MDAYFRSLPLRQIHPLPAALQQPIRVAISLRQPAPVSFSRKETGAPTTAAAHYPRGFAATLLVTIDVTNADATCNSDVDDGAAVRNWNAPG